MLIYYLTNMVSGGSGVSAATTYFWNALNLGGSFTYSTVNTGGSLTWSPVFTSVSP